MLDSGGFTILPRAELEALRLEAKMPFERKVTPEVTDEKQSELPDEVKPDERVERAMIRNARQRLVDVHTTLRSAYEGLSGIIDDQSVFDDETIEDPSEPDTDDDEDDMMSRRLRKARAKARKIKLSPAAAT